MNTTSKPWGTSERLVDDGSVQLERIQIVSGGYSSIHVHVEKWNQFWVAYGALVVVVFDQNRTEEREPVAGGCDY